MRGLSLGIGINLACGQGSGGTPTPTPTPGPTFTVAPSIAGTPQDGAVITFTSANWTDYDSIEGQVVTQGAGTVLVAWTTLNNLSDFAIPGTAVGSSIIYQERATKAGNVSSVASSAAFGPIIASASGTTFDPANKGTEIQLDVTQLIATFSGTAASRSVRGLTSKSGDFDVWFRLRAKNQFGGDCAMGLCNASGNLNSYAGSSANSIGLSASGAVFKSPSTVANLGALTFDGTKFYGHRLYSISGVRTWEIYDGSTLLATISNANLPTGALYIFATLTRSTNEMVMDFASPQGGATPWS